MLTRLLPGRRTPWVAVVATSGVSVALALTGEVAVLAETLVLLLLVVFAAVNCSVLLERRHPVDTDHFRVPTLVPWLALASCLYLFTRIDADIWARGLVLVGLGAILALVNSVRTRRAHPESRIAHAAKAMRP